MMDTLALSCTRRSEYWQLRFGVPVRGTDGTLGTLHQVFLEPGTLRVTHLGVRTGFFFPRHLRVPLGTVVSATEEEIRLCCTLREAAKYRQAPRRDARSGGRSEDGQPPGASLEEALAVGSGLKVSARDGIAGRASRLLVEGPSGQIADVIVDSGLFNRQSRRLPAAWVRSITATAVEVDATVAAVAALPRFRRDREIRADIMDAWYQDVQLRAMLPRTILNVSVRDGVATVEGYAWSRARRQRLEERARTVPGVLEVRSAVVADDELVYEVADALAGDPNTGSLRPRVTSSLGTISLEGRVPDRTAGQAALEVAARVPRVRAVLNRLWVAGEREPAVPAPVLQPRVGQRVYTRDGRFGRVKRVILSATDRRVTAVVAAGELPAPEGAAAGGYPHEWPRRERCVVIPADWIAAATSQVLLRIGHQEAASRPEFQPGDYGDPDAGWEPPYPYERAHILLDGHRLARCSGRSEVRREPATDILGTLGKPGLADREQTGFPELLPERRVPILIGRGGDRLAA